MRNPQPAGAHRPHAKKPRDYYASWAENAARDAEAAALRARQYAIVACMLALANVGAIVLYLAIT